MVNLEIHIGQQPQDAATLDHLLPITYGGDDMPVNFVIACHLCNNLRLHFRNPQTFKEIIIEILKNETVCDKWHTFTQKELYVVRQIIYRELAKRDSEWAFEIVKDNHLKPL